MKSLSLKICLLVGVLFGSTGTGFGDDNFSAKFKCKITGVAKHQRTYGSSLIYKPYPSTHVIQYGSAVCNGCGGYEVHNGHLSLKSKKIIASYRNFYGKRLIFEFDANGRVFSYIPGVENSRDRGSCVKSSIENVARSRYP